jgi:predicted nucleic acid-binding protein
MSNLVVDASVALKWVLNEPGYQKARSLVGAHTLAAPDFLLLECGNALWATARRKIIASSDAAIGLAKIAAATIDLHPIGLHAAAAQAIAFEIDRTAYDSLYLAVAIALGAQLVTADEKLARAIEDHAVYRSFVRRLGA